MLYLLGLVTFYLVHLIPFNQNFREHLVEKLSHKLYLALFALITFLGVILAILGWNDFSNVYFYEPSIFLKQLNLMIMLPVAYLWVAAEVPNNIKRFIKHPMLLGMKLWALGHLLANGDLRSMILFISFFIFSIVATVFANRKPQPESFTSKPITYDIAVVVVSLLGYIAIAYFHGFLFRMPVMPYFFGA